MDNQIHIIVARYREDISWLFEVLREHTTWRSSIYNDGPLFDVPIDIVDRINVYIGDKVPAESTKYLQFIIDNYEISINERVLFTQADPLYHNYTFCEVLKYTDKWNIDYQNLCLSPHPPPWGCANQIFNGSAPNITYFSSKAKVWSDTDMDDLFNGRYYRDPYVNHYNNITTVSKLCDEWGIPRATKVDKCYCALFSTNWKCIHKIPLSTWKQIHDFIVYGNKDTSHMSQKLRACILESMWAVLFTL